MIIVAPMILILIQKKNIIYGDGILIVMIQIYIQDHLLIIHIKIQV